MTAPSLKDSLLELVAYHAWTGRCLLDAAGRVPAAGLAGGELSAGSLFDTLRHVLDVNYSWRQAAQGLPDPGLVWEVEALDDLAAVRTYWLAEDQRLIDFVSSLDPEELDRPMTPAWKERSYRIWEIVVHIVNHQTEHGNELAWELTRLGHSPGEMGFLGYVNVRG